MGFMRYHGPEPVVSFNPTDGSSEQATAPFVKRLQIVEASEDIIKAYVGEAGGNVWERVDVVAEVEFKPSPVLEDQVADAVPAKAEAKKESKPKKSATKKEA